MCSLSAREPQTRAPWNGRGILADRQKEYSNAFSHFNLGKQSLLAQQPYDPRRAKRRSRQCHPGLYARFLREQGDFRLDRTFTYLHRRNAEIGFDAPLNAFSAGIQPSRPWESFRLLPRLAEALCDTRQKAWAMSQI